MGMHRVLAFENKFRSLLPHTAYESFLSLVWLIYPPKIKPWVKHFLEHHLFGAAPLVCLQHILSA